MRALITGGAGFIGFIWRKLCSDQGHHVSVLDDLSTGRMENIDHLRGGSRSPARSVRRRDDALVAHDDCERADVVFHLAAAVGVGSSWREPVHTIEANVHGTETVLKHASRTEAGAHRVHL